MPNGFYQDWLEEHYLPMIRKALGISRLENLTIVFTVDNSRPPAEVPAATRPAVEKDVSAKRVPENLQRGRGVESAAHLRSFNFVVGPSNSFCARGIAGGGGSTRARLQSAVRPQRRTGLGKTHLIQAMGQAVLERGKGTGGLLYHCAKRSPMNSSRPCSSTSWEPSAGNTATLTCSD